MRRGRSFFAGAVVAFALSGWLAYELPAGLAKAREGGWSGSIERSRPEVSELRPTPIEEIAPTPAPLPSPEVRESCAPIIKGTKARTPEQERRIAELEQKARDSQGKSGPKTWNDSKLDAATIAENNRLERIRIIKVQIRRIEKEQLEYQHEHDAPPPPPSNDSLVDTPPKLGPYERNRKLVVERVLHDLAFERSQLELDLKSLEEDAPKKTR